MSPLSVPQKIEDHQVFFRQQKTSVFYRQQNTSRPSIDNIKSLRLLQTKPLGLPQTIENLQILYRQWKTSTYSISNRRPLRHLWTIEDLQVFYGQQKSSRKSLRLLQTIEDLYDNIKPLRFLQTKPLGLLQTIANLQVLYVEVYLFYRQQKISTSSIDNRRPLQLLWTIEPLQVVQFFYRHEKNSSSLGLL